MAFLVGVLPASSGLAGGTEVLLLGALGEPSNLLPPFSLGAASSDVHGWLFDGLVGFEADDLTPKPGLARAWDESADGLSITFHLDPSAVWHDGHAVTARDVLFTHELVTDPESGSRSGASKRSIAAVTAADDSTVTFRFHRRTPYAFLDINAGKVLPAHLLEGVPPGEVASGEFARAPVGTGPFRLRQWRSARYVELEAVKDHYRDPPRIDRLRFVVVPDMVTLLTMLERGEVHVVGNVPSEDVERLRRHEAIRVDAVIGDLYTYIGWNTRHPLFASAQARRALALAVDRETICQALGPDQLHPFIGPLGERHWAFAPGLSDPPFDPDRARALLAEQGWADTDGDGWLDRDGETFEFVLRTNAESRLRSDLLVILQDQWASIGVRVVPERLEYNTLLSKIVAREFETAYVLSQRISVRPSLERLFHSDALEGGFNVCGYSSAALDSLLDGAVAQESREAALPYWYAAQERLLEDQPFTWLLGIDHVFAARREVRGVAPDESGYFHNLTSWEVLPDR